MRTGHLGSGGELKTLMSAYFVGAYTDLFCITHFGTVAHSAALGIV